MVKWTPQSEADLDSIQNHIAQNFNVDLAIKITHEIIEHVERILSLNPLAGSILESNPLFSKIIFKGNIIFYTEHPLSRDIYIIYIKPRGNQLDYSRLRSDIGAGVK